MKIHVDHSKKLAYLPITKNASTTFSNLFSNLGWAESQYDLLPKDYKVFGHFRDPIKRHFKGTATFLYSKNLSKLLEDKAWQRIWATAVMDIHSYPITWSLGNGNQVEWLPIHENLDTNKITKDFLKEYGIEIDNIQVFNEVKYVPQREIIYKRLLEIHSELDSAGTLSYFYDADIVVWCKILEKYIDIPEYRI
jgi:hypothetical protein